MTNIIILFLSILGGFFVGNHLERRQTSRWQFFCDLQKYISLLKSNIKTKRLELQSFNQIFASNCSGVFAKFLLEQGQLTFLTKHQAQLLISLFDSLSATTSCELLNNLDFYEQQVNLEFSSISNEYRSRNAFVKLAVLGGVVVGILLM